MGKLGRSLDKGIAYLGYGGIAMGLASLLIMMSMIFLNVVLRYLFKSPLVFVVEYAGYLYLVLVFMGLAYSMRADAHVKVELITRLLPRPVRAALEVIYPLVAIGVAILYLYYAWGLFAESLHEGARARTMVMTPLWIPQMFLWIGLIMFILAFKKCISLGEILRGTGQSSLAKQ